MAYRTMALRPEAIARLRENPSDLVGRHFAQLGRTLTLECRAEADRKLQRGSGKYASGFRSTVDTGPRGVRLRVTNDRKTADGRDLAAILEKGSRPHIIRARKAAVLVFDWPKAGLFPAAFPSVNHPGTRAYRIMETALKRVVRRGR